MTRKRLISLSGEQVEDIIKKYIIENKLIDPNTGEYEIWIEYQMNYNGGVECYEIYTNKEKRE